MLMDFAGISLRFQLLIRTVTDSNVQPSVDLRVMWEYGAWNNLRMRADTRTDKNAVYLLSVNGQILNWAGPYKLMYQAKSCTADVKYSVLNYSTILLELWCNISYGKLFMCLTYGIVRVGGVSFPRLGFRALPFKKPFKGGATAKPSRGHSKTGGGAKGGRMWN